jgi:hypothetical protein
MEYFSCYGTISSTILTWSIFVKLMTMLPIQMSNHNLIKKMDKSSNFKLQEATFGFHYLNNAQED